MDMWLYYKLMEYSIDTAIQTNTHQISALHAQLIWCEALMRTPRIDPELQVKHILPPDTKTQTIHGGTCVFFLSPETDGARLAIHITQQPTLRIHG